MPEVFPCDCELCGAYFVYGMPSCDENAHNWHTARSEEIERARSTVVERFLCWSRRPRVCADSFTSMVLSYRANGDFRRNAEIFDACVSAAAARASDAHQKVRPPPESYLQPWAARLLASIWAQPFASDPAARRLPASNTSTDPAPDPSNSWAMEAEELLDTPRTHPFSYLMTCAMPESCAWEARGLIDAARVAGAVVYRSHLPEKNRERSMTAYRAAYDAFLKCAMASHA